MPNNIDCRTKLNTKKRYHIQQLASANITRSAFLGKETDKMECIDKSAKDRNLCFRLQYEYSAIREEIITRIKLRQQLIAITLALAGAFLAAGLTNSAIALVYPPISLFLAFSWAQNDWRIRDAAYYIRKNIEESLPANGWETFMKEAQKGESQTLSSYQFTVLGHGGIFLTTQAMAIGIGISQFGKTPVEIGLIILDLISVYFVIWIILKARR